jgi:nucleolar pre-ribosomal-associated protein 2
LQRLLSLDKSFDSFEERVQEAARILDISLDTQFTLQPPTSSSLSHISRLDFVLRWLLDKLSAQPETCQHLPSWILLRRILERMPSAALAKSLSVASPINTCSTALAHLFPPTSTPTPNTTDDAKPSTKKRKRQSAANDTTSDHSASIFAQITVAIRVLISRSIQSPVATDAASGNRVHALLRLDHADLVRFVKHTLYALLHLRASHNLPPSHVAATLALIQDLAILQPNASVDPMDISFCIECLWPAALLLQSLHSDLGSYGASQQNATRSLDRLLATHLFVPARVAFYASKATVQKKSQQQEVPGLVQRLEPLRSQIMALLDEDTSDPVKQGQLLHAYACVPLLLDLAVRCAPIGNPKQRIAEAPWIHLLFNSLSETITKASDAVIVNQKLNEMFDVLSGKSLVLDTDVLSEILDQRCNLSTSKPDFPLVARILNMNASMFTDVNAAPAKALFEALTNNGEAKASKVSDLVSSDDWSNPRNVCYKIVVPLMHAYARTRNLPAFLDQWSACLAIQISSKKSSRWLLWADLFLEESLRAILETSLTSAQISELLDSRQNALSQSVASSSIATPEAFANIVILNAIISALKTDTTVDTLMPYLESLLAALEGAFLKTADISDLLSAHMIGLASRIYQLWYPIWSTSKSSEEVQMRNASMLDGPITKLALKKIQGSSKPKSGTSAGTISDVDSAFVFIASICDMQRQLTGHESDYAHLFCRAALPSKDGESSSYASQRPAAFLTILTGFPGLLACVPATERAQLFKDLFGSFFSDSAYSSSVLLEFLDAVFATSDLATKDDLFAVVCEAIESSATSGSWLDLLLQWPLKGFSRQQREKILDVTVSAVIQETFDEQAKQQALDLVAGILELPNATAKISVTPGVLWDLAGVSYNSTGLDAFETICQRLLGHILDTKEQDRSKSYLEQLSVLASDFIGKQKDLGLPSNPGKVLLVKALFEAFEARFTPDEIRSFPHCSSSTIDSLVKRLWEILSSSADDELSGTNFDKARIAVQVYTGIPPSVLALGGSSTEKYAKRFAKKLRALIEESEDIPIPILVRCFQQLSSAASETEPIDIFTSAEHLLRQETDAGQYWSITDSVTKSVQGISENEKLSLMERILPTSAQQCTAERVMLVRCILSAMHGSRKHGAAAPEVGPVSILVRLLELLNTCSEYDVHQQLVACITTVLREQVCARSFTNFEQSTDSTTSPILFRNTRQR